MLALTTVLALALIAAIIPSAYSEESVTSTLTNIHPISINEKWKDADQTMEKSEALPDSHYSSSYSQLKLSYLTIDGISPLSSKYTRDGMVRNAWYEVKAVVRAVNAGNNIHACLGGFDGYQWWTPWCQAKWGGDNGRNVEYTWKVKMTSSGYKTIKLWLSSEKVGWSSYIYNVKVR